jgi:hypothetical protein
MDSDDIAFPWRFSRQLHALAAGLELVVSTVVSFRTAPMRVRPGLPVAVGVAAFPFFLAFGCPFSHPTLTMRRSALDRLGGYRDVVAEDYDLYVRACLAGMPIARTAVPVIAYRRHPGQTSNNVAYDAAAASDSRLIEVLTELRARMGLRDAPHPGGFPAGGARSGERIASEARRRGAGHVETRCLLSYASGGRGAQVRS